jgi:hypothetical protein
MLFDTILKLRKQVKAIAIGIVIVAIVPLIFQSINFAQLQPQTFTQLCQQRASATHDVQWIVHTLLDMSGVIDREMIRIERPHVFGARQRLRAAPGLCETRQDFGFWIN